MFCIIIVLLLLLFYSVIVSIFIIIAIIIVLIVVISSIIIIIIIIIIMIIIYFHLRCQWNNSYDYSCHHTNTILLSIKFQLQTFHIFLLMCICSTHICFAQSQNLKYNIKDSLTELYIYIYIYIGMNVFLTDWHRSGGNTGFPPYYLMIFLKAPALKLMPTLMPPPSTYKWTSPH